MSFFKRLLRHLLVFGFSGLFLGALAAAAVFLYLDPKLPPVDSLREVQLQVPMRVYTRDGELLAEFGEKRRIPIHVENAPPLLLKAFLAAEDNRFYIHPGVDYQGLARAVVQLIRTGRKRQGGSTITMQVARNFFLSREKTYLRKLNEILLALKIERVLSKDQILELYLNKIYLGNRAYGVGAAAKIYYGVDINELSLPQMAMIAGLPKAPSRFNPIANPARALLRRNYVLGRMRKLGDIDEEAYQAALSEPVSAHLFSLRPEVEAPYVAEMARAEMRQRYGDLAYTGGFRVFTSIDAKAQQAANTALRKGLLSYDRRHGYRGPEQHIELAEDSEAADWDAALKPLPVIGGLRPALVLEVQDQKVRVYLGDSDSAELDWDGLKWAREYRGVNRRGPKRKQAGEFLREGDIVRVRKNDDGQWVLSQVPQVAGALISLDPKDGGLRALVGGFDFYQSKFNRAVQARRQPGSGFKPFIYSAALEKGFTPATLINDAPVVFQDAALESAWRPENYSGKTFGETRLRVALANSRNLVSIRILRAIGIDYAINYASRFGFDPKRLPRNLSLALGSGVETPWEMARGYSALANGGFRIEPWFLQRIVDGADKTQYEAHPATACPDCEEPVTPPAGDTAAETSTTPLLAKRIITPQNWYLMNSLLRDVIRVGTGRRARVLKRKDLAGKTGTTNEQRDAWFNGFNQDIVAITWVGFDSSDTLGNRETGGHAALPIWIDYMREVLKDIPVRRLEQPPGLVTVRIDPDTGLRARPGQDGAIFEVFRADHVPKRSPPTSRVVRASPEDDGDDAPADGEDDPF